MSPSAPTAAPAPRLSVPAGVRRLAKSGLVIVALLLATKAGTYFLMAPYASLAWPPTGIALAVLVLCGVREWPSVAIGTALGDVLLLDLPPHSVPFVVLAGTLYPVVAAKLLCHSLGFRSAMDRVRDVLALLFVAAIVGAATATIAVGGPRLIGDGDGTAFWTAWTSWLAGGVMGVVVFAPLILTWAHRPPFEMGPRRAAEALVVYSSLLFASLADFGGLFWRGREGPTLYLIFPFVMWAALRFGPRGAALAHLIASSIAIAATADGLGPFVRESLFASLLHLHSFTLVIVMTSLLLSATNAEREGTRRVAEHTASRLNAVVASISDAILVCDSEQRLVMSNPALLRLFGLDALPATIAQGLEPLGLRDAHGVPIASDGGLLARSLRGETLHDVRRTFRHLRSGRDISVDVSSSPIVEGGQVVGAVSVSRDVTEKVELDRMRNEFFSVAAHELKTPLAVQKAAVQALQRLPVGDAPARLRIESIARGAERMNRVVEDMLDVSQIAVQALVLRVATVDLSRMVRACVDAFTKRASDHTYVVRAADPVVVDADASRIEQVLRNLLENAAKYSPAGSTIEVDVRADDGSGIVSVRDQGVGIPLERQSRIFERFYRAHAGTPHEHCSGLGVGLYVSRNIVERHGGKMSFESEPGSGSTFTFRLPRQPAA